MRKDRKMNTVVVEGKAYPVFTSDLTKTVKTLAGNEIERKAKLSVFAPKDKGQIRELLGDNLEYWGIHGYLSHAKICGANTLVGVIGSGDRKLTKQFKDSIRTFMNDMGSETVKMPDGKEVEISLNLSEADAIKRALRSPRFSSLQAKFEAMAKASNISEIDYTIEEVPLPKWFTKGDADDDDEEVEDTEE